MAEMKLTGVLTALVTPMQGGAIDEGGLRGLVRSQLDGGISGLVVCGSTGEGATLSPEEQNYAVSIVAEAVGGRVPVVAGIGARATHEAIASAEAARGAGADALLVLTPPYNKPTQAGLLAHFHAVAENVRLPICLYNVPGRTAVDLLPETTAQLSQHPRILGIKDATGSLERTAQLHRLCPEDFSLLSGDDLSWVPFMAAGGSGCISVLSNLIPARMVGLLAAMECGDWELARNHFAQLLPLASALFVESNPIPVKTAASWMGLIPSDELRLPLTPLTPASSELLQETLALAKLSFNPRKGAPSSLGPGLVAPREDREAQTVELEEPPREDG